MFISQNPDKIASVNTNTVLNVSENFSISAKEKIIPVRKPEVTVIRRAPMKFGRISVKDFSKYLSAMYLVSIS